MEGHENTVTSPGVTQLSVHFISCRLHLGMLLLGAHRVALASCWLAMSQCCGYFWETLEVSVAVFLSPTMGSSICWHGLLL